MPKNITVKKINPEAKPLASKSKVLDAVLNRAKMRKLECSSPFLWSQYSNWGQAR